MVQQVIAAYETVLNPLASSVERKNAESVGSQKESFNTLFIRISICRFAKT